MAPEEDFFKNDIDLSLGPHDLQNDFASRVEGYGSRQKVVVPPPTPWLQWTLELTSISQVVNCKRPLYSNNEIILLKSNKTCDMLTHQYLLLSYLINYNFFNYDYSGLYEI